jgi:hypothetical protein
MADGSGELLSVLIPTWAKPPMPGIRNRSKIVTTFFMWKELTVNNLTVILLRLKHNYKILIMNDLSNITINDQIRSSENDNNFH